MSCLARRQGAYLAMSLIVPSDEQQAILDLGLSTVRIRAGAGTGKTTTVAMVIANLIQTLDIDPEQHPRHHLHQQGRRRAGRPGAGSTIPGIGRRRAPGRGSHLSRLRGPGPLRIRGAGRRRQSGQGDHAHLLAPAHVETFHRTQLPGTSTSPIARTLDKIRSLGDRLGDHLLEPQDVLGPDPARRRRVEKPGGDAGDPGHQ